MQQHQIWSEVMPGLPDGYARYRADYGETLRCARKTGGHGKQAMVAFKIGISLEALSRIECGKAKPRRDTMEALLALYGLSWGDVAIRDGSFVPPVGSPRRDSIFDLGSCVRDARREAGLTLRAFADQVGISYSQLSRIERGLVGQSSLFHEDPDFAGEPRNERPVVSGPLLRGPLDRLDAD